MKLTLDGDAMTFMLDLIAEGIHNKWQNKRDTLRNIKRSGRTSHIARGAIDAFCMIDFQVFEGKLIPDIKNFEPSNPALTEAHNILVDKLSLFLYRFRAGQYIRQIPSKSVSYYRIRARRIINFLRRCQRPVKGGLL